MLNVTQPLAPQISIFYYLKSVNKHELCTFWAALTDECAKNPDYMLVDCAAACMSCDRFL